MKNKSNNTIKKAYMGITLLEALIYLGIFSAIFTVIIQYALSVTENNQRVEYQYDLTYASTYVHEHLNSSFQSSTSSEVLSGNLYLYPSDHNIVYYLSDGTLYVDEGSGAVPITAKNVYVTNFSQSPIYDRDGVIIAYDITINMQSLAKPDLTRTVNSIYKH